MAQQFCTSQHSTSQIQQFIQRKYDSVDSHVIDTVRTIISDMKSQGDQALIDYTNRLDKRSISDACELVLSADAIKEAYHTTKPEVIAALELASKRITAYHQKQMPEGFIFEDADGVTLGNQWRAVGRAGLYVPGGLASYPSSVLMNAIPAKVAGVKELVMVVPSPQNTLNPVVLAAAHIAQIDRIFTIGGAQAIAALAYGTNTVPAVDVVVGPGNAYVATAKRELYGVVGIDMIAGPSEIFVVVDKNTDPKWVAADLLSQAEHDVNAQSVLVTDEQDYADAVCNEVARYLETLERSDIARQSWENNGVVIVDNAFANVIDLVNAIAPEHLELAVDHAHELLPHINNAGAVFMGRYTPEAIGDYVAGPSHVLPTSGTARFSSGLSVYDFLKRMSVIGCTPDAFASLADATHTLAKEEGLTAHALSVGVRKK